MDHVVVFSLFQCRLESADGMRLSCLVSFTSSHRAASRVVFCCVSCSSETFHSCDEDRHIFVLFASNNQLKYLRRGAIASGRSDGFFLSHISVLTYIYIAAVEEQLPNSSLCDFKIESRHMETCTEPITGTTN